MNVEPKPLEEIASRAEVNTSSFAHKADFNDG
jgi:hypothetical protein